MRRSLKNRLQPLALLVVAGAAASANAQCTPEWLSPPTGVFSSGTYDVQGINATVRGAASWFPPTGGQQLVIGGQFGSVGGAGVNNIAAWDGSFWNTMDGGMPGGVIFSVITVPGSQSVIATGNFGLAGNTSTGNIAQWDGFQWNNMNGGLVGGSGYATAYFGGNLYVGGEFTQAGASSTAHIAMWDGSNWQPVSGGTDGNVDSMAVYGNALIVGGDFTHAGGTPASHIAAWTTSGWIPMGTGTNGPVYALCVHSDGSLYAGGGFTTAGGVSTGCLARWNNAWQSTGSILPGQVYALADYFDTTRGTTELVIGGVFAGPGGTGNIVQYDGSNFTSLGTGPADNAVRTLVSMGEDEPLVVGGDFNTIGGLASRGIATWSGAPGAGFSGESGWAQLKPGATGAVRALLPSGNGSTLYVGGDFLINIGGSSGMAQYAASTDGTNFAPLTDCFGCGHIQGPNGWVSALGTYTHGNITLQRTDLIMGGQFTQAGGVNVSNIANFGFQFGYTAMGSGINGPVWALLQYPATRNSPMYATGEFDAAGGTSAPGIAKWNGSSWSSVGSGLSQGYARAMCIYNGQLIVAGDFRSAGGVSARSIASWDGTSWQSLPGSPLAAGIVQALVVFNGQLIVGGTFDLNDGTTNHNVIAWDGASTWTPMDINLPSGASQVSALVVHNGVLYAGGEFFAFGGNPDHSGQLVQWNGSSWSSVSGMEYTGEISSLASAGGALWAGGGFGVASGHAAPYLAKMRCACYANCDNSATPPNLNVGDFTCFLQQYAAQTSYANCDGSTQAPTLNVGDFTCFLQRFAAGCP